MLDTWFTRSGSASERYLDGLARWPPARGLTPDRLTHAALGCGVLAGALFFFGTDRLALALTLLSGALDAVDGRVARLGSGPTAWGGVLDLIADRIVEASVLLGI